MHSNYNCFVEIKFSGGDVAIEVDGDGQKFRFLSGVGFVALPNFFFVLSNFYKSELNEALLDCYGNADYYSFSTDGKNMQINHISHYTEEEIYTYIFDLSQYVMAVDKGFSEYLQKLHEEGLLPLKNEDMSHPLSEKVVKAYSKFSSIINGHKTT